MESDSMLSPFSLNNSSSICKSTYSTCNLQLNNNSNTNNSISSNLVGNDAIANQHAMMKSNNIINNNTPDCNKLQLAANPNLNMFVSGDANRRNVNGESVKEENIANYKSHLMDDSQKFNLNNKHISCQQRDTQNNHYSRMMNDLNGSSMPLNLCQVRTEISLNFSMTNTCYK